MNKIEKLMQQLCPQGVEFKELGKIALSLKKGTLKQGQLQLSGKYPVINSGREWYGYYGFYNNEENAIAIASRGEYAGFLTYVNQKFWAGGLCYPYRSKDETVIITKFIYFYLKMAEPKIMDVLVARGSIPALNKGDIDKFQIPIPPLPIQQEIVAILDKFTQLEAELEAELEARKTQYEYYRNELLNFEGKEVEWKTLDKISTNFDSKRKPVTRSVRESGKYPYYGASGIVDYVRDYIFDGDYLLVSEDGANLLARNTPIAFSITGKTWVNNHAHVLKFENYPTRRFVEIYLNSIDLSKFISGAAQPKLNKENLNKILIPIPPLSEQERIVGILDKFDALVNGGDSGSEAGMTRSEAGMTGSEAGMTGSEAGMTRSEAGMTRSKAGMTRSEAGMTRSEAGMTRSEAGMTGSLPAEIEARRKQYEYYRGKLLDFKPLITV